jgi:hypothetical protein
MTTQTIGSQFPLVPMVNVKGLNSQAITDHIRVFSGIPRSFRMVSMNNPTSKSAEQTIIYDHQKVYHGKYKQKKIDSAQQSQNHNKFLQLLLQYQKLPS